MKTRTLICTAVAAVAATAAAPASATVTIGSDLSASANAGFSDATYSQAVLPGRMTTSPIDGVIHVWRAKGGAAPGTMRLRVLRPAGGGAFTGAGTGPTETISGAFSNAMTFAIEPLGLPIAAGDRIGLDDGVVPSDSVSGMLKGSAGASTDFWSPLLGDGVTSAPNFSGPYELLVNADVEPDADCDGLGDDTHDPSVDPDGCSPPSPPGDTSAPDTTITKKPKDKTRKKTATFEFISNEPGSTFECSLDGGVFQPCTSPHGVKVKKGKHSFQVRATDAAANVDGAPASDDWKVKKKKKKRS